jgi:hypothetical protein
MIRVWPFIGVSESLCRAGEAEQPVETDRPVTSFTDAATTRQSYSTKYVLSANCS